MINDLDEGLRQLLLRELPKKWQVNIEFDQPRREWSARLNNKPTLNLFLYDVRENNVLRQNEWQIKRRPDGSTVKERAPVRVDLHYMITAWAAEPEDEHSLLAAVLMALFRYPSLPEDLLPASLQNQPVPIPLRIAEADALRNPADIWGAMDNELRPAISCIVTLAMNPYQPITTDLVRSRDLRFRQITQDGAADQFWMVGGTVRGAAEAANVQVRLVERGLDVMVSPEGKFIVGNLEAGGYTLAVTVDDAKPQMFTITVPSPNYDIDLEEGGSSEKAARGKSKR